MCRFLYNCQDITANATVKIKRTPTSIGSVLILSFIDWPFVSEKTLGGSCIRKTAVTIYTKTAEMIIRSVCCGSGRITYVIMNASAKKYPEHINHDINAFENILFPLAILRLSLSSKCGRNMNACFVTVL